MILIGRKMYTVIRCMYYTDSGPTQLDGRDESCTVCSHLVISGNNDHRGEDSWKKPIWHAEKQDVGKFTEGTYNVQHGCSYFSLPSSV